MPSMIEIILLIILHIWLCRQGGDHFWSESRLNISLLMLKVEHFARGKGLRLDKSQSSQTPGFSLAFAGLFIATKVKTMDEEYRKDLQLWFGLTHASFCVMPRVFMEAMPPEWQEKMAQLLFEYSDTIKTDVCGVHSCFVTAKDGNNRFMRMPEDILNYRHPRREFIESFLKK